MSNSESPPPKEVSMTILAPTPNEYFRELRYNPKYGNDGYGIVRTVSFLSNSGRQWNQEDEDDAAKFFRLNDRLDTLRFFSEHLQHRGRAVTNVMNIMKCLALEIKEHGRQFTSLEMDRVTTSMLQPMTQLMSLSHISHVTLDLSSRTIQPDSDQWTAFTEYIHEGKLESACFVYNQPKHLETALEKMSLVVKPASTTSLSDITFKKIGGTGAGFSGLDGLQELIKPGRVGCQIRSLKMANMDITLRGFDCMSNLHVHSPTLASVTFAQCTFDHKPIKTFPIVAGSLKRASCGKLLSSTILPFRVETSYHMYEKKSNHHHFLLIPCTQLQYDRLPVSAYDYLVNNPTTMKQLWTASLVSLNSSISSITGNLQDGCNPSVTYSMVLNSFADACAVCEPKQIFQASQSSD